MLNAFRLKLTPLVLSGVGKKPWKIKPPEVTEMVRRPHHWRKQEVLTKAVSLSEIDWFTSCWAIDTMVMFNAPFSGQQELSLLGSEQTTSSLMVMIIENH